MRLDLYIELINKVKSSSDSLDCKLPHIHYRCNQHNDYGKRPRVLITEQSQHVGQIKDLQRGIHEVISHEVDLLHVLRESLHDTSIGCHIKEEVHGRL